MKFKYSGSKVVHPYLRWATEQQLNLRWNEVVVKPFSNATTFFKSTTRAMGTSNSVDASPSMVMQEVDRSLEANFKKITEHLSNYRDGVISFINNAFRHAHSYEDPANFLDYMELSKNEAIKDLKGFSSSRLVSDVKRHYEGLDDIIYDHISVIENLFSKLKNQYQVKAEHKKDHDMRI